MDECYSLIPRQIPQKLNAKNIAFTILALGSCFSASGEVTDVEYHAPAETINVIFERVTPAAGRPEKSHKERDYMLKRLSHFLNDLNEENWDEYGAYPIERRSYDNAVGVINNTPEEVLELWNVFPSPNGTISFEFKAREIAAMSIGNSEFSYIARNRRNREAVKDRLNFDINAASEALAIMSRHLGYL